MERNVTYNYRNESTGDPVMAKGVSIIYGDVAPEAKENFLPTISEMLVDTTLNLQKYNMQLYDYANPCELYQTVLDGTAVALPPDPMTANIGLWSEQLSNDDGTFEIPITVTLTSEGQYSSQGFTFTFDKFNEIYPTKLTIQWFRVTSEGIEDLSGAQEFFPDSGVYFCRNQIENFNKIVIKFYKLNMPYNRLKVEVIDYGYGTVFSGEELRQVRLSQYVDPISSGIKISTCDFTLDSHTDMVYSFQSKQPLSVSFNGKLLATCFVKTSKRTSRFLWDINAEDYIGIMDGTPFVGGMYTNASASSILSDIFAAAKVPCSVDDIFDQITLSGHIPYTTCREALMQVCFASLATVNTANTDVVEVKRLENDVPQPIPLDRIMQGQSFENGETVTRVDLTAHTYKAISEKMEAYKAEDGGTGENILVKFSEPLHGLTISNGEILSSGANYAHINANDGCVLIGGKYEHAEKIETYKNLVVLTSDKENVKTITSATLISPSNVKAVLENCYNWLTRTDSTSLKIIVGKNVERKAIPTLWGEKIWGSYRWGEVVVDETITDQEDVNLGEIIKAETEYLGHVSGRLIQQSFGLGGNVLVKEAIIK